MPNTPLAQIPYADGTTPVAQWDDVLLAALVALEKKLVLSFTTSTARDAAITSPVFGMVATLSTPKQITFYDGTAWRHVWGTDRLQRFTYTPGGEVLATTSGTMTDWVTLTAGITVPAWATGCHLSATIGGCYDKTGLNVYNLRCTLGGTAQTAGLVTTAGDSAGRRMSYTATPYWTTLPAAGAGKSLVIQAQRIGGSNQLGVDGASNVAGFIEFFA